MPAPSAPTGFAIAAKSIVGYEPATARLTNKGAARLVWDAQAGVNFEVERRVNAGAWHGSLTAPVNTTGLIVAGLDRGEEWDFRVRARDSGGVSAWATSAAWTVPALPTTNAFTAPTSLAVGSITSRRAKVTWTDNSDNEAGFVIRISEQGGTVRYVVVQPLVSDQWLTLDPETSYAIAIAPFGGRYTGNDLLRPSGVRYPLLGDFSAEVSFVTLPAAIEVFQPNPRAAYINREFEATVYFSDAATVDADATGLPSGLAAALAGDEKSITISGTPDDTNTPARVVVAVSAENGGGSDSVNFEIYLYKLTAWAAWRDAELRFVSGAAMSFVLIAYNVPSGAPDAPSPFVYTAEGLPPWAVLATDTISGTPDRDGEWLVTVTASNGLESVTADLRLVVPGVDFTSAATKRAYVGQYFAHTLAATPTGAVFSAADLPAGATIVGNLLSGTPEAAGTHVLSILAEVGAVSNTEQFTLVISEIFTASAALDVFEGEAVSHEVVFNGHATPLGWTLIGAPAGLTIAADMAACAKGLIALITGSAAEGTAGFYTAYAVVKVIELSGVKTYRFAIEISVSGGLLLAWLHSDPHAHDLQIFPRSQEVRSYYATPARTLWLKRGDDARIHVVFRDGATTLLDLADYTAVNFILRPQNDFDAEPYLTLGGEVGTAVPVDTFGEREALRFEFPVTSAAIEDAFDELNQSAGAEPLSAVLICHGEFEYVTTDRVRSTQSFLVDIEQDYER